MGSYRPLKGPGRRVPRRPALPRDAAPSGPVRDGQGPDTAESGGAPNEAPPGVSVNGAPPGYA